MAVSHDVEVADVAKSGPGLAFIAFPQAILEMPAYQNFWAILFFFMILLLGLDSQFVGLEAVATSFSDIYTSLRKPGRREMFLLVIVLISQILAIPLCASGGMYLFKLYDYYGASGFCLLFLSFSQCIAVAYVYGGDKMWRNVTEMVGFEPARWYILLCWKYITPAICFATTAIKILKFESLQLERPLGKVFEYSTGQEAIGWIIGGFSMFPVVYFILYKAFYRNGKIATSLRQITKNLQHNLEAKDKRVQHSVFVMKRSPSEISLNSMDSSDTVEKIEIDIKDIK